MLREFMSYLPQSRSAPPPARDTADRADRAIASLDGIVPADSTKAYNMKDIIIKVCAWYFRLSSRHSLAGI